MKKTKETSPATRPLLRPDPETAAEAVRTLIRWAGDDPTREGLADTPRRVLAAFEEFYAGYRVDPETLLSRTFEEIEGYDEMVVLRDIRFTSHCEHHLLPIEGVAHVAYLPERRVVGISKLARLVEAFARRLQIQERMTSQIAQVIDKVLKPKGVGVVVEASHGCMSYRGINKPGARMVTSTVLGSFRTDRRTRAEFLDLIRRPTLSGL